MMKSLVQVLAVASTVMVILTGAGTTNLVEAVTPSELAQSGGSTQSDRMLQVALPEFATVRLTQGGSYTGELTGFSSDNLTLSASGQSMTLAHSQIREVEFNGNVWIPGESLPLRIHSAGSHSFEDVPFSALAWDGSSSLATLNLQQILTQGEFMTLTADSSFIHAVKRMNFEPSNSDTMTVRVLALKRQP